jgi:hypothetical protein
MKVSATYIFLPVLLYTVFVSSHPVHSTSKGNVKHMSRRRPGNNNAAGAAYFITNEPSGNFVVSADVANDGTLTLRQAAPTGGNGAHGVTNPVGPDPLFSQGAVKTSKASNVLATVNAGSNTISLFAINPVSPAAIQKIGDPVPSGGDFPMSLAINAAGTQLCALNGGANNGVSCFNVNNQTGLTPLANTQRSLGLNQTTPPNGPAGTTSHIVFSEDNKQLIASVKGIPPQPGFFAVWDIATDGSLSNNFKSIPPNQGGLLPFSMTVIEGQNALLATDAGVGFDIVDLANQSNSNRSSVVPIQGQGATCWSSHSPKTGNFYLTDIKTSLVTEVNVDSNLKGSIVKQYPQGNNAGTIDNDIATVGSNDFMYVLAANATTINVVALNAPGNAQNIQSLDVSGPAKSVGLALSGNNIQGMTTFVAQ